MDGMMMVVMLVMLLSGLPCIAAAFVFRTYIHVTEYTISILFIPSTQTNANVYCHSSLVCSRTAHSSCHLD